MSTIASFQTGNLRYAGVYDPAVTYQNDEYVTYNDAVYVCVAATIGNLPTDTDYWSLMAGSPNIIAQTTGAGNVNLPAGVVGESVGVNDVSQNCGTNSITIITSGSEKFMGLVENFILDIDGSSIVATYADATNGWVITDGSW